MVVHEYRSAGGVVVDADGRVLVLRRPRLGQVRLPKGHVEEGESDEEAAVREVAEESGYVDVEIVRDLGVHRVEFDVAGEPRHIIRDEHYFQMRCVSDRCGQREAQFEPVWMSPAAAVDALTFEAERLRVVQVRDGS